MKTLVVNRCPSHGFWAITIDDEHGGVRVTPSKCCGRWDNVKTFRLSEDGWRELALQALLAADSIGQQAVPSASAAPLSEGHSNARRVEDINKRHELPVPPVPQTGEEPS